MSEINESLIEAPLKALLEEVIYITIQYRFYIVQKVIQNVQVI